MLFNWMKFVKKWPSYLKLTNSPSVKNPQKHNKIDCKSSNKIGIKSTIGQ